MNSNNPNANATHKQICMPFKQMQQRDTNSKSLPTQMTYRNAKAAGAIIDRDKKNRTRISVGSRRMNEWLKTPLQTDQLQFEMHVLPTVKVESLTANPGVGDPALNFGFPDCRVFELRFGQDFKSGKPVSQSSVTVHARQTFEFQFYCVNSLV